ncbi:hypothetical protein G7Y79_00016g040420 [Physcia stellaris]|nr:hypothetical protein G7Y79_00016g040420 [Physcia stellaris]
MRFNVRPPYHSVYVPALGRVRDLFNGSGNAGNEAVAILQVALAMGLPIAWLCMADVVGNAPGHDCANWRRSIRAAHFRNALYQNYHNGPDYHPLPNAFAHGTTQLFAGQTAAATFASLIAGSLTARHGTKKTADEKLEQAREKIALLNSEMTVVAAFIVDPQSLGSTTHQAQQQSAQPKGRE